MNGMPKSRANLSSDDDVHFLVQWIRAHWARITESFWFGLTFILFLLLGPFSAIAVLIGLGSLANEESREQMNEPARL